MKIRKKFRVESSHIVRNCSSDRCSNSVHGHSAIIEIVLESRTLDNAGMVYDFGLLKGSVKQWIDSMDHCHLIWNKDQDEYKDFFKRMNKRWIQLPFNPSAEMLSVFIFKYVQQILNHHSKRNGEGDIKVVAVRYHETETGWAECDAADVENLWDSWWDSQIMYSDGVLEDWSQELKDCLFRGQVILNPKPQRQVYED